MKKRGCFQCCIYIVVLALSFLLTACGSDEAAPSADTSRIPQTVFFNDTGLTEHFLFTGRAFDNTNVNEVLVSGDNGATWHTAEIDNDLPNHDWDVEWTYLASSGVLSAGMHTVLVRVADRDGNESISDPLQLESLSGSATSELLAVFAAASTGDVIGLSTGVGDAYGDSGADLTIPVVVDITVQGSGYGDMVTSGNLSPVGNSVGTVLQTGSASGSLFSVDGDLTIRDVRLSGAVNGIRVLDDGGADPQVSVENCLFDRQSEWAVYAGDDAGDAALQFIASIVDASSADSSVGAGGIYLESVSYEIADSEFYFQSTVGSGAAVFAVGSAGVIDSNIFEGNAHAVWASSGIAMITSNDFSNLSGPAYTTNGINLTGDNMTVLRHNLVLDNDGYGVRIGGSANPVFYRNVISGNQKAGVLIDFSGAPNDIGDIVLGDMNDFNTGFNDIYNNEHPVQAGNTEVYVTTNTPFSLVPVNAHNNYWGVDVDSAVLINARIYDNKRTPANDRAIVDPSPYRINSQNF